MIVSGRYLTQSTRPQADASRRASPLFKRSRLRLVMALVGCSATLLAGCGAQSDNVLGSRSSGPDLAANASTDADQSDSEESGNSSDNSLASDDSAIGSGSESDSEQSTESEEPATNMSTDPSQVFEPGTCYQTISDDSEPELVECDTAHDIEVYNVGELPGDRGAPFQGLDRARALCDPAFKELTGIGIGLATIFDRTVLRPSEETWSQGDRVVTCLVQYPETITERLEDIDPVRGFGLVSPYGMEVGDCYADFEDEASSFTLISCDETHDVEVFVAESLADGSFPGDTEIEAQADELCFGQAFEDFVGQSYGDSNLFSLRSMPTQNSWDQGDRTINCLLTLDEPRVGSFEGSGL